MVSRSLAANSLSIIKAATRKISGRPPPTIPTAILIESGSVMRMAWQKTSINLSMSFLPAKLNARPNLIYAQRAKKHHERQAATACTDLRNWHLADISLCAATCCSHTDPSQSARLI